MNKLVSLLLVLALALNAFAGRTLGFGITSFNKALPPQGSNDVSAVFSPMSFEFDVAAMADAFDPITKADTVKKVGVLTDLENAYAPILERFRAVSATNGLMFTAARGFCVPDRRKVSAPYHCELQRVYGAEICPSFPTTGSEYWFRARMDGEMEDFEIPPAIAKLERNDFYDLVSVRTSWQEPFPVANTRDLGFWTELHRTKVPVKAICDIRRADLCERNDCTICRLPLRDDAWFFMLRPKDDVTLDDVRLHLDSDTIDNMVVLMDSVTELNIFHGPTLVTIPTFDLTSRVDLLPVMAYFQFPSQGYIKLDGTLMPGEYLQYCRFRLDESGLSAPIREKPAEEQIAASRVERKFVLNRPFAFFVYHRPSRSILVAGQYLGPGK